MSAASVIVLVVFQGLDGCSRVRFGRLDVGAFLGRGRFGGGKTLDDRGHGKSVATAFRARRGIDQGAFFLLLVLR